jgi:hypothetical protein
MWASLAIAVMWLAVLFDALFGPDIVSNGVTSATRVPSAIIVALFAYLCHSRGGALRLRASARRH